MCYMSYGRSIVSSFYVLEEREAREKLKKLKEEEAKKAEEEVSSFTR